MDLQPPQQFQCVHCNSKFKKKRSLILHLKKYMHLYRCTLCNKTMCWIRSLRFHLWNHFQKGKLCTLCNRSYTNMYVLKVHLQRHVLAESYPYTCHICNKIFLMERTFRCHLLENRHRKFYRCKSCGRKFNSKLALQRHKLNSKLAFQRHKLNSKLAFQRHKLNSKLAFQRHKLNSKRALQRRQVADCQLTHCSICKKDFLSNSAFRIHSAKKHITNKHYICTACQKSFSSYLSLMWHRHMHCNKRTLHQCLDCNKNSISLYFLKKHLISHIKPVVPLRCNSCFKIFKYQSRLQNHIRFYCKFKDIPKASNQSDQSVDALTMQKKLSFTGFPLKENKHNGPCAQYADIPKESYHFTDHQNSSSVDSLQNHFSYCCPHCNTNFQSLHEMQKHLRKHIASFLRAASQSKQPMTSFDMQKDVRVLGYPPEKLQIQQQGFSFYLNSKLTNMDTSLASPEDRNKANVPAFNQLPTFKTCFKTQSQQQDFRLQLHKKVLNKDNAIKRTFELHTCNVCPRAFVHKSDLKRHALTHEVKISKITFKCPVCLKKFDTQQGRKIHEKLSHYVCPICDCSFASRFCLFSHTSKHSELTRFNQKPLEEAMFSQTQCDTTARMVPTFSPYGYSMLDRHAELMSVNVGRGSHSSFPCHMQGEVIANRAVLNVSLQGLDRLNTMQAPCLAENTSRYASQYCLDNGFEERNFPFPMIPTMYNHAMTYHNEVAGNSTVLNKPINLPEF